MQLFGIIAAFILVVLLSVRGTPMWKVMATVTVLVAATSGAPLTSSLKTIVSAFTDKATIELALTVFTIGMFSTIMREFDFLTRTVQGLGQCLANPKAALMAAPALVGSMPVLGGAAVSAPLVDKLGEPLGLSPEEKAAVNLIFRHGLFFVFPFQSGIILTARLSGFPTSALISTLWPMTAVLWGTGYLSILRGKSRKCPTEITDARTRISGLVAFLRYGAPLLLALVLGLALKIPLWAALMVGSVAALLLGVLERKPMPNWKNVLEGGNPNLAFAMFWLMAFRTFVTSSPALQGLLSSVEAKGISPAVLSLLAPLSLGFVAAAQTTTLGVTLPAFLPMARDAAARLNMSAVIYGASFIAYFVSPLHLCLVLTCQHFRIPITRVYRYLVPVVLACLAALSAYAVALSRVM